MSDGPRKAEGAVQILIMLTIGSAAGAASFTHVHNVAAAHGQPGWLAWADAIVLELMSIASGLELRRRKRARASVRFPAAVLGCAVVLSLAAQVVEAEPSPIGWTAAAVPALGFLVMVKIALGYTGPETHVHGGPVALDRAESVVDLSPHGPEPAVPRSAHRTGRPSTVTRSGRVDRGPSTDRLLPAAQRVRDDLAARGRPLTREALAEALRGTGHTVSNVRASELLKTLRAQPPPPAGPDRPRSPSLNSPRRPRATAAVNQQPRHPSSTETNASLEPRTLDQQSGEPTS
jgi:hypothetical protein